MMRNTLPPLASNDLFDGVGLMNEFAFVPYPKRRAAAKFFILAFSTLQSSHEP